MPVKFCLFSDIHYFPDAFPNDSREWLDRILDHAVREQVDFVVHLGDLTHNVQKFRDYVDYYNDFRLPTYHVIGNHDNDSVPYEGVLERFGLSCGHYHFDCGGFRFIVLDPNYYCHDGQFIHYSASNYYEHGPERDWIPPEQLEWMRDAIETSPYPCVCLSHESLERENDGIRNQAEARAILNAANERRPGHVRLCLNGHHHLDNLRILDQIVYFNVNSASFFWLPEPHACFPPDITRRWQYAPHTLIYNAPLHAIVTLTEDGGIRIDGMKSDFFMDVIPAMSGNDLGDNCRVTATIQSADLRMAIHP